METSTTYLIRLEKWGLEEWPKCESCLSSKCEFLSSNPGTPPAQKKKKRKVKKGTRILTG
jgi:hypothetical protein